jgi:hypothetical protein
MDYNQIDLATDRFILRDPLILDNTFHRDPLIGYLRDTVEEQFTGGRRNVESDFEYDGEIAGAYDPGDEFEMTERQAEQAFALPMQFYYGNVSATLEDLEVFNTGPRAVYRFLNTRFARTLKTIGAGVAISQYLNGSRVGYTRIITGLAEALNDGLTASWDGSVYPAYGDTTRNGTIGTALNSVPFPTASTTIMLKDLEDSYSQAMIGEGEEEPNIGVTTYKGYSAIKSKFQSQQRFNDTQDPKLNFNGLKFNNSVLMRSRYCPGTVISGTNTNDVTRIANAFIKKSSKGALTVYPTVTSETLWWLNVRRPYMRFLISKSKKFGFGFTGFKAAQGNNKVAGQILASIQYFVRSPRNHAQVFGFTK